jgi:hypothetical protein
MSEEPEKESATTVADALLAAAKRAATYLENIDHANHVMRSAAAGILPDGTPVTDMLAELRQARADVAALKRALHAIGTETYRPKSQVGPAMQAIRDIIHNV